VIEVLPDRRRTPPAPPPILHFPERLSHHHGHTADYGGPKRDERVLTVTAVEVSEDRTKARLTIDGMQAGHLVDVRLNDATMRSAAGRSLLSTEAWYTLNRVPDGENSGS
jgi:hypothetical protein